MSAVRISVAWMTEVPQLPEGGSDFDHATWHSKDFPNGKLEAARAFAQKVANANDFGQAWLYVESAPHKDAPEWMWERDYDADEIYEKKQS